MSRGLLKQKDAADYLAMSPKQFRAHVQPHIKRVWIDRHPRYPVTELDAWVAARAQSL